MLNLLVKPGNIRFSAANYEPFFGTLFVYDKVNNKRVSESFSFLMSGEMKEYSDVLQARLTTLRDTSDAKTTCKRVIFQVDQPSTDYVLVLRVDKVLQANPKKFSRIYEREKVKGNKVNKATHTYDFSVARTFEHRQVLCWSIAPMFTKDGGLVGKDGQEFRTFWKHSSADQDIMTTLIQCASGVSKKLSTLYAQCPFTISAVEDLSSVQERLSPSCVLLRPSSLESTTKKPSSSSSSSSSTIKDGGSIPYGACTRMAYHFSTSNSAGAGPGGYYEQYYNDLYVYPVSAAFTSRSLISKVRNISVSIGLVRVDDSGRPEEEIPAVYAATHSREVLAKRRWSTCAWHENMPVFQDEFKLRLPIAPSPRHFIEFEFHQVSVGNTRTAGTTRLIGVALLPLCAGKGGSKHLLPALAVDLPILRERPTSFYARPTASNCWNKGRAGFRVKMSLASTVLTRDRALWKFANALDSVASTPEFARQSLRALGETADFTALALRVPVLLGELAWIMCNVPQLSAEAFAALLRVLERLRTHHRSAVIAHYIRFIFVNPPLERSSSRAFFEVVTTRWVELLSGGNSDNDDTVSISIRLAEHLFALIHKSMALYLESSQSAKVATPSSSKHNTNTNNNKNSKSSQPSQLKTQADRSSVFSGRFVGSLRNLIALFRWDVEVCWGADFARKVATFLAGLFALMDRGVVMDITKHFIFSLQPYDDPAIIRCKLAAAGAIARYEHYVQLNLPTTEPLPDGVKSYIPKSARPAAAAASSSAAKDKKSKILKRNEKQAQIKTGFWAYVSREPQYFWADSILDLVECYLGDKFSQEVALQAARTLRDVFIRHDTDSRYNADAAAMEAIARMYIPYLEILIKQPKLATYSLECRRTLYACLLWLLKNLSKSDITAWAKRVTFSEFAAYFGHLKSCVQAFTLDAAVSAAAATLNAVGDMPSSLSVLDKAGKVSEHDINLDRDSWPFKASAQHDLCLHTEAYMTVLEHLEQLVDLYGPKEMMTSSAGQNRRGNDDDDSDNEDDGGEEEEEEEGGGIDEFVKGVFAVYSEIMSSGATKQIIVRLYASLSSLVEMFPKQFFVRRTPYMGQICKQLVEHCNSHDDAVRTVAATFLYKLMKLNTAATGKRRNFSRVKVQCTIGASELVSSSPDDIQGFVSSLRLIMHYNFQENSSTATREEYERHLAKKDARLRKREGEKKIAELRRIKSKLFSTNRSASPASSGSSSPSAAMPRGAKGKQGGGGGGGGASTLSISSSIKIEFDQKLTGNNNNNGDDEIEIVPDTATSAAISATPTSGTPALRMEEMICDSCQCAVFEDDRLEIDGKVWHQNCFRCAHCNCRLSIATCAPFEDRYYCPEHYDLLFKSFTENSNNNNSIYASKRRMSVNSSSRRGGGGGRPGSGAIGGSVAGTNEYTIYNRFGDDVQDLVKRLMRVVSDSSMMSKYKSDPEMTRDLYWRIAKSYVNTPALRFAWLSGLSKYNAGSGYPIEAAECLCHMAAFAAEYLHLVRKTRDGKPWMPAGYRSFAEVSPNIALDESFLEDAMPDSESATDMREFTEEGLVELLVGAAEALVQAQLYEVAHQVYKLVIAYHEHFKSYEKVAELFGRLEGIYREIITANARETRFLGVYYRVGLYGEAFEEANGREFVYRENGLATLSDICSRLVAQYTARFKDRIKGEVKIIQASDRVDPALKEDLDNAWIQVTFVEPYFEDPAIMHSDYMIDRSLGVSAFVYSKAFTEDGSKTEDKARLFKRKTVLHTERAFPYVKNRLTVVRREEIVLTPIEAATEDLDDKTREISKVLRAPVIDPKRLTPLLQGVCLVMVGVGPAEGICKAFFDPAVVGNWPAKHLLRLQDAFQEFLAVVHTGLGKHEHVIDPSMRPMHDEMVNGFAKLQLTVMKMISRAGDYIRSASAAVEEKHPSRAESAVALAKNCPLAEAIEAPKPFVTLKSNVPVLCPQRNLKRKQSKLAQAQARASSASESSATSLEPLSKESSKNDGEDEDEFQKDLDIISDINTSMSVGSVLALSRIGSVEPTSSDAGSTKAKSSTKVAKKKKK